MNRFDDETKQAFLELYDKVDADFEMPSEDQQKQCLGTNTISDDKIMTNAWSFLHDEIMNDSPPASSASNDRITDATEKDYKDFWESNGVTVSESGNLFLNSEYNIDSLGVDSISLNEFQIDLNNEESNMTNSVYIPDLPNAPNNSNGFGSTMRM